MTVTKEIVTHGFSANTNNAFGTITASSQYDNYHKYNALCVYINANYYWVCLTVSGWWKIELIAPAIITQYKIYCADTAFSPDRSPQDWTLQGSNDDSNWTTVDTVSGETGWSRAETRTYTCDSTSTAYKYYKIDITDNNGDASYSEIGEIYFYAEFDTSVVDSDWGSNLFTDTGAISSESEYNAGYLDNYAVDENDSTRWSSGHVHRDSWLKYDLGSGNAEAIQKIRIKGYENSGDSGVNLFVVYGSNNDSDWVTLYANIHPADEDWHSYLFENTTEYRYYRFNFGSSRYEASLYGLEAFSKLVSGWTGKICGATNPSKVCGVPTSDIGGV